jgi:hypothetical protein
MIYENNLTFECTTKKCSEPQQEDAHLFVVILFQ